MKRPELRNARDFSAAAAIIKLLEIGLLRLLTNNNDKLATLSAQGIQVSGAVKIAF
jgi:GTP cyclohydrolase II